MAEYTRQEPPDWLQLTLGPKCNAEVYDENRTNDDEEHQRKWLDALEARRKEASTWRNIDELARICRRATRTDY